MNSNSNGNKASFVDGSPNREDFAETNPRSDDTKPEVESIQKPSTAKLHSSFYQELPLLKRFIAEKILAIDIGRDRLYYLVVKKTKEGIRAQRWGEEELPGEDLDRYSSLEIALKYIREEIYRSNMAVHVSFFIPDINTRQIILPKLKQEELTKAIFFKNKTDIPNFAENDLWNYKILEIFKENNIDKLRILVSVVPRVVVDDYLKVLKKAKLKPATLIPRPFALLSAYHKIVPAYQKDVFIDIDNDTTQICLIINGKLNFVRSFAIGAANLQSIIETDNSVKVEDTGEKLDQQVDEDSGQAKLSMRDRLMKKVHNLQSKQSSVLNVLVGEIQRSMQFFKEHSGKEPVQNIYLTGFGAKIESVLPFLKNHLNYPVQLLCPFFSDTYSMPTEHSQYTGALGASLFSDKSMNMVPAEFKQREIFKNLNILVWALGVIFLAYAGYSSYSVHSGIQQVQSSISFAKLKYLELNPIEKQHQEIVQKISTIDNERYRMLNVIKKTPQFFEVLKLFSNEVPENIRFVSLSFTRFDKTPVKNSRSRVTVKTDDKKNYRYRVLLNALVTSDYHMADVTLINFMNHLNDLKYFSHIRLLHKFKKPENQYFEFELEALIGE